MYKIYNLQTKSSALPELYDKPMPIRNAMLAVMLGFSPIINTTDSDLVAAEANDVWALQHYWPAYEMLDTLSRSILFNKTFVLECAKAVFVERATISKTCYVAGVNDLLISQLAEPKNQNYSEEAQIAYYSSMYKLFANKQLMARLRYNRNIMKAAELDFVIEQFTTDLKVKYYSMGTWRRMMFEYVDMCSWIFDTNVRLENWHKFVALKLFVTSLYTQDAMRTMESESNKVLVTPLVDAVTTYFVGEESMLPAAIDNYSHIQPATDYEV